MSSSPSSIMIKPAYSFESSNSDARKARDTVAMHNNQGVQSLQRLEISHALGHFQQALSAASKLLRCVAAANDAGLKRCEQFENSGESEKSMIYDSMLQSYLYRPEMSEDMATANSPVYSQGLSIASSPSFISKLQAATDSKLCCAIVMFNLGLVHHIAAIHDIAQQIKHECDRRTAFVKAKRLYEQCYQILVDVCKSPSGLSMGCEYLLVDFLLMAVWNNAAHVSKVIGDRHQTSYLLERLACASSPSQGDDMTMMRHRHVFRVNALVMQLPDPTAAAA